MRIGQTYKAFGCTWIVDRVYALSDEFMKANELYYRNRYTAHVIESPEGYAGVTKVDAAFMEEVFEC